MEKKEESAPCFISVRQVKLLIVDDSEFICERLVAMFSLNKYIHKIFQANNSTQAYDLFNSVSPDIVILDIRIPGDNGILLLENFKKIRPEVKIIMLTSYPYVQYRRKCLELGADSFFSKAGDMDSLERQITKYSIVISSDNINKE